MGHSDLEVGQFIGPKFGVLVKKAFVLLLYYSEGVRVEDRVKELGALIHSHLVLPLLVLRGYGEEALVCWDRILSVSDNSAFSVKLRCKGPSIALLHPEHHFGLAGLLGLPPLDKVVYRSVRSFVFSKTISVNSWLEGAVLEVIFLLLGRVSIDIHLLIEVLAPVDISDRFPGELKPIFGVDLGLFPQQFSFPFYLLNRLKFPKGIPPILVEPFFPLAALRSHAISIQSR